MEAVTEADSQAAGAKSSFAVGAAGDAEGFVVDKVAADQQDEQDVDQGGAEEPLKALRLTKEGASALPELMDQKMEQKMALQLQPRECSPHYGSIQEQKGQELQEAQFLGNYQAYDQLGQDFAHHNLVKTRQLDKNGRIIPSIIASILGRIWIKDRSNRARKRKGKLKGSNHCELLDPLTLLFSFYFPFTNP